MSFFKNVVISGAIAAQLLGSSVAENFFPCLQIKPAEAHKFISRNPEEQQEKIEELKNKLKSDGYDSQAIDDLFNNPKFKLDLRMFEPPKYSKEIDGKKGYERYRIIVGVPEKINVAPHFVDSYRGFLNDAESKKGVDKTAIAGVLAIECNFNETYKIGKYLAFNAIVTQIIHTDRPEWAYRELKELLKFAYARGPSIFGERFDIFDIHSSSAGALGNGQFIPSTLNSLFVGERGNLLTANPWDMIDSIYSVPHFLINNGWDPKQNGKPIEEGTRNWLALYRYNHDPFYVKAVLEIMNSLKPYISKQNLGHQIRFVAHP